jgi:hypothetical protein
LWRNNFHRPAIVRVFDVHSINKIRKFFEFRLSWETDSGQNSSNFWLRCERMMHMKLRVGVTEVLSNLFLKWGPNLICWIDGRYIF